MPRLRFARNAVLAIFTAASLAASACAPAQREALPAPHRAGAEPVRAEHFMAAAANPLAAEAGRDILARGGNAADAAIAMQMVLNLVEPQSSGIGGGGFLLYYDAATGNVSAYDGRETAPAAAAPAMFLQADGTPKDFEAAAAGGGAVGVPGLLAMLEMVHRDRGKLPWAELFAPAIRLARDGFPVSPRLHAMIAGDPHLKTFPETAAYFFHADGAPLQTGEILRNPALADALQTVADGGARVFYNGPIARDIAAAVHDAASNPGQLRETDFAAYRAKRREAVCGAYRTWRICGMPPPSSGGITLLETLGILESFDLAALDPESPEAAHLMAEASRLAFADRNRYLGDPDFARAPAELLLDPAYLARRARLVSPGSTLERAFPGILGAASPASAGTADSPASSTTHIGAVDGAGNAVAFTSSIEAEFGARLMVHGFLLNNELTDFSFRPENGGMPAANRVEAGKRPLSSMAPTFVFDADGRLALTVGSPGGQSIIGYVLKTLVGVLDWGLNIQDAIDLPNVLAKTGPVEIENGAAPSGLAAALEALGHAVERRDLTSGLQGIAVTPRGLEGGADRRREGAALGG